MDRGGLVRTFVDLRIYIYARTTKDQVPDTVLNGLIAQLAAVFAPDDASNECTISWVRIQGKTSFYPGDLTDQALAVVPVSILLTT
jgi:hypothetical protein